MVWRIQLMIFGNFYILMRINLISHTKSESNLLLYTKSVFKMNVSNWVSSKKTPFEFVFYVVLLIHKGYFVVKKLVGNVGIKNLKLSSIQI